jgi:hypothetical protein
MQWLFAPQPANVPAGHAYPELNQRFKREGRFR